MYSVTFTICLVVIRDNQKNIYYETIYPYFPISNYSLVSFYSKFQGNIQTRIFEIQY